MAETLEITKEAAIKAHDEASTKGKTLLENLFGKRVFQKDIKQRVTCLDDALRELGKDKLDFEASCVGLSEDEVAYKMLKVIAEALNEGWTPDWSNGQWDKWYPWFKMDVSSSAGRFSFVDAGHQRSGSVVGSRLCFKSRELSNYAGKQFEDVYRKVFIY